MKINQIPSQVRARVIFLGNQRLTSTDLYIETFFLNEKNEHVLKDSRRITYYFDQKIFNGFHEHWHKFFFEEWKTWLENPGLKLYNQKIIYWED